MIFTTLECARIQLSVGISIKAFSLMQLKCKSCPSTMTSLEHYKNPHTQILIILPSDLNKLIMKVKYLHACELERKYTNPSYLNRNYQL